jgi:hypothetical protein
MYTDKRGEEQAVAIGLLIVIWLCAGIGLIDWAL